MAEKKKHLHKGRSRGHLSMLFHTLMCYRILSSATDTISSNRPLPETQAILLDNCNLMLRNESMLWQNFDHATDSWLLDAKLKLESPLLTSWKNSRDPSVSRYTHDLDSITNNSLIAVWNGSKSYWLMRTNLSHIYSTHTAFVSFNFEPTNQGIRTRYKKHPKRKSIVLPVALYLLAAIALLVGFFFCIFSRRVKILQIEEKERKILGRGIIDDDDEDHLCNLNLHNIMAATNALSEGNKLGEGSFGPVYKGKLLNGMDVAIKRLSKQSRQGIAEFKNEVVLIKKLQHKNLVRLLGYCVEGDENLLIYEYMSNKSLDVLLFDSLNRGKLDWDTRMKIVKGTTRGLQYLHEDSRFKIIHRDLKAGNILLDDEMNPKISDFGTARIFGCKQTDDNTQRIVGTYGYMSPEYALGGIISEKSDIYSFGVLLLEIISGKKATRYMHNDQKYSLIAHAWDSWCETKGLDIVDEALSGSYSINEVMRCVHISLLCVQDHQKL